MNELQRQVYLSALGIETYMPRWHLPCAAQSHACELPAHSPIANESAIIPVEHLQSRAVVQSDKPQAFNNLLDNLLDEKAVIKTENKQLSISAKSILASLSHKANTCEPFSLSILRPCDNLIIIDSRNTSMAFPTELLIRNLLINLMPAQVFNFNEEVLRWPMIENSFTKRTEDDARIELQTWLSVQQEIRPFTHIWLMGANAARYFMSVDINYTDSQFKTEKMVDSSINALVLPSLIELLKSPLLKRNTFAAITRYHH
jgi:hypothetical protein